MKQLKALPNQTQAFISILVAAAVFYLNKEQGKKPYLPVKLKTKFVGWAKQAEGFVSKYKLNGSAFRKFVLMMAEQKATDALDEACDDLVDSFKSHYRNIEKDVSISADQLQMLKDSIIWFNSASPSALTRIRKNMNKVGLSSELMEEFRQDTESQEPYVKAIKPVVKKLTGKEGTKIPLELLKEIREKAPEALYKRYLDLRKTINSIYKNELLNLVRDNNGKPIDVDKARKALEKKKMIHNLPQGFEGLIGEDGQLYTKEGKRIDGVPQYPVRMNPNYDPKSDNGNVFTVILPTTDAAGKNNVQHFYTTEYRRNKTSQKFETVNVLIKNKDKYRKHWLQDMRSKNDDVRIPSTIVELSFLTCARIGTPGNATKGGRTQGLTTLDAGNVKKRSSSRVLDYIGKDGVHQRHVIAPITTENRLIVNLLDELVEGKQRKDLLFEKDGKRYTAAVVRQYFKRVTGLDVGMHKIRTLRGTVLAQDILENLSQKLSSKKELNQTLVDREFKAAITKVGELLGHVRGVGSDQKVTWATASQSYIDPEVQQAFYARFADKGVRLPSFLRKKLKQD